MSGPNSSPAQNFSSGSSEPGSVPLVSVEPTGSNDNLVDPRSQSQAHPRNSPTDGHISPSLRHQSSVRRPRLTFGNLARPELDGGYSPHDRRGSYGSGDSLDDDRDQALNSPTLPITAMPSSAITDNLSFKEMELPGAFMQVRDDSDEDNSMESSSGDSSDSASLDTPRGEFFNDTHRRHRRHRHHHHGQKSNVSHRRGGSDARAFNRPRRATNSSGVGDVSSRRPTYQGSVLTPRAPTVEPTKDNDDHFSNPDSVEVTSEKAEEDVCFPLSEEQRTPQSGSIDFEEMEDFARETRQAIRDAIATLAEGGRSRHSSTTVSTSRKADLIQKRERSGSHVSLMDDKHPVSATLRQHYANLKYIEKHPFEELEEPEVDVQPNGQPNGHLALPKISKNASMAHSVEQGHNWRTPLTRFAEENDRFSFFNPLSAETKHAAEFHDLVEDGQSFAELFDESRGTWWLNCREPTDMEMKMLSKAFNIHPLTNEDIRIQESREKVELFKHYYFVSFRTFEHDETSQDYLEAANFYLVVFRGGILTFQYTKTPHAQTVRRRIRQLRDYVSVSSDWICYALIDDITDAFQPLVAGVEAETEAIEDSVMMARPDDTGEMLRRIGQLRKRIMGLLKLLGGKADVIKMFAKRCNENWNVAPTGEIGLYLGDIQDHIVTMFQNLSSFEKILSRAHSNYLAYLSVDSIQANNQINNLLGKLTVITVILVPLNLVTGLFGMNVTVPGRDDGGLGWFFGILGCMVGAALFLFLLMRRLRLW